MLNDKSNYKPIDANMDKKIISQINKFCAKYDDKLTKKEKDYLINFNSKTSNFYGLPKIHKSKEIKYAIETQKAEYIEIPNPKDLKFRPIIAGPACPTNRLSNLTDILIQPFLQKVKSYVKDDIHFLNLLPNKTESETLLATFDVTSLYSNIPHELGKQAIKYWIQRHPEILHPRFNEDFIIDSLDLILKNNSFQFNNNNYIQILGTAMGTKMAPAYATLTLAYLEETLYTNIEQKYGNETTLHFIQSWKRYLDDCFILWKQSWGNIHDLFSMLQDLHTNIKFTMEHNTTEIPFLDILVRKHGNGKITTDIYRKPTDTQQYLHFKSHHPKNCIKSIPYSLARRICTIVSDKGLLKIRLEELRQTLCQRGYPLPLIDKGISLAEGIPLAELRNHPKNNKDQHLAYVTTYNRCNPELFVEIHKELNQLQKNDRLNKLLNETKIIKSKRQPKNLKQTLTSAYFGNDTIQGVKKCNNKRCGVCNILIEGTSYLFKNSTVPFEIKRNLTCNSKNVLYVIECSNCHDNYIGCTISLSNRTSLHKSNIKIANNRNLYVSKHIFQCSGGHFKIMPIYQTDLATTIELKEQHLIDKYKPALNRP